MRSISLLNGEIAVRAHTKFRWALVSAATSLALLAGCAQAPTSAVPPAEGARALQTGVTRKASSFATVYRFKDTPDGAYPLGGLTTANGILYGTTSSGGEDGKGSVFEATVSGNETVLYSFKGGNDGQAPVGAIVVSNRTVYGTTEMGSVHKDGIIYAIVPGSDEHVLHAFMGGDGSLPMSGLTKNKQSFYGSTDKGGTFNYGTLFSVDAGGGFTEGHSFGGGGDDGADPSASLAPVGNVLYGTTQIGGAYGGGTVFALDPVTGYSVIHSFGKGIDGAAPGNNSVVQLHGVLYGATCGGGSKGQGTVFTITPSGAERVLYNFGTNNHDGACPNATMISRLGILYGVTYAGGAEDNGTVFSVTVSGRENVVHSFKGGQDGANPIGALVFLSGKLYGVTSYAGLGYGTIFSLKV